MTRPLHILAACLLAACLLSACASEQPAAREQKDRTTFAGATDAATPDSGGDDAAGQGTCPDYDPLRRPFFGDLHVHTSYSFDAYVFGTRNDPAAAYRFAKGDTLYLAPLDANGNGTRPYKLERKLDFAAVTDHAEFLGETMICTNDKLLGYDSQTCVDYRAADGLSGIPFGDLKSEDPQRSNICGTDGGYCVAVARNVWRRTISAANDANDQCNFSALVAYEWTGTTNNNNLHRNVIFAGDKIPDTPVSYFEEPTAQGLWAALEQSCIDVQGCNALVIPHNPNKSNGKMFEPPKSASEAELRAALEPLVEIIQHKGESECQLTALNNDEECRFEKLTDQPQPENSFARGALGLGLKQQLAWGINPFKLGFVGATDTHNATPGAVEEANYIGHVGDVDDKLADRLRQSFNAGGLTVAWAEQNTRNAIFAAFKRRETYATSGTRPIVRLFGGWSYDANICGSGTLVASGYSGGVPMGGTLPARPLGAGAPIFVVRALRDPGNAPSAGVDLQRVQIIKGWVDGGTLHEKVYNVAGENKALTQQERDARVDLATCQPKVSGSAALCRRWEDPDFVPGQLAYYYARVLENPSCRFSWRQCRAAGISCDGDPPRGVFARCCQYPKTIQERAWTSPVWYQPSVSQP